MVIVEKDIIKKILKASYIKKGNVFNFNGYNEAVLLHNVEDVNGNILIDKCWIDSKFFNEKEFSENEKIEFNGYLKKKSSRSEYNGSLLGTEDSRYIIKRVSKVHSIQNRY